MKTISEFGSIFGVVGKPSASQILIKFISQFSELKYGRY
jgi:hypothetical protein